MKRFFLNFMFALLALSTTGATNAYATGTCLDNSSMVCITEELVEVIDGTPLSKYTITNLSDTQIFAFAITNTGGFNTQAYSDITGWVGKTVRYENWDDEIKGGAFIDIGTNTDVASNWVTGSEGFGLYTPIGTFESLFGPTEDLFGTDPINLSNLEANIYYNKNNNIVEGEDVSALTNGVTFDEFYFYGNPQSNFVAFDQNGSIITSSLTTTVAAVPEPSTYLMLATGLILLISLRRKQKA